MLGGAIVTYISWRWIFWIDVPVGVAADGGRLTVSLRTLSRVLLLLPDLAYAEGSSSPSRTGTSVGLQP